MNNLTYRALGHNVLAVAVKNDIDWAAYIGAVPGWNFDAEAAEVAAHGDKLPEGIARAIFPHFEGVTYRK